MRLAAPGDPMNTLISVIIADRNSIGSSVGTAPLAAIALLAAAARPGIVSPRVMSEPEGPKCSTFVSVLAVGNCAFICASSGGSSMSICTEWV